MSHERDGLEATAPGGKIALAVKAAIILNILSFPVTIAMNVPVIMVLKTRPRWQSKYNILLACLAGTVSRSRFPTNLLRGAEVCHKRSTIGMLLVPQGDLSYVLLRILKYIPIFASLFSSEIY